MSAADSHVPPDSNSRLLHAAEAMVHATADWSGMPPAIRHAVDELADAVAEAKENAR